MPFKKIDAKKIVEDKARNDQSFKNAYQEVAREYQLIRKVVKARKEKGLTQKDLADMIGLKQQVISRLEREKHVPTLNIFLKILDGVDLELKLEEKNKEKAVEEGLEQG